MTCGKNIQIDIFKYRYMKYTNDMDKETRIWQGPKPLKKDAAAKE